MTSAKQDQQASEETAPRIPQRKARPRQDVHDRALVHVGSIQIQALSVGPIEVFLIRHGSALLAKCFTTIEDAVAQAYVFAHVWIPECSHCGDLEDGMGTNVAADEFAIRHEADHAGEHSVTIRQEVVA